MALPTISSITPSTLWSAGQLLTVIGTNFKVWTIPAVSNAPLPAPTPTVRVTVDGVIAERVAVQSATQLTFYAPSHAPTPASVVIANLDSSGVPISGETSAPSTITYVRPSLTDVVDLERVHSRLMTMLSEQIIDNVVTFVSADYSETPFELTMVGKMPALLISGPSIVESGAEYVQNQHIEVGTFDAYQPPEVVDMEYDMTAVSNNSKQLVNLQGIIERFFRKTRTLSIPRDPTNLGLGNITYVLEKRIGSALKATTTPNKENVRSFEVSFHILGVPVEGLAGFPGENLVYRGGVADNIITGVINTRVSPVQSD